jgi:hypothetical protein
MTNKFFEDKQEFIPMCFKRGLNPAKWLYWPNMILPNQSHLHIQLFLNLKILIKINLTIMKP